ncbi:MAG: HD-GYP domain-containing protein [Spirochaetaceae bacterium]|jgi:HD-GYP domain-containing protein (c-di-GMP phosphodiesterase class II)|nr:HD-GYP domain-containing protein [Spirochaetaceae bacterium]
MNKYTIHQLVPGQFFTAPLFLDDTFMLASPEMQITANLINALKTWKFDAMYSRGEIKAGYQSAARQSHEFTQNDAEKLTTAEQFYIDVQIWTGNLLENVTIKQQIRFSDVAAKVKQIIDEIGKNRRFLLQVQKDVAEVNDESFLLSHAVKSTIVSLVIGMSMQLPMHKLIELGVAALLHEIGMTQLPPKVYLGRDALTPVEQELIFTHPKIGYDILRANDFPLSVCRPALEHHERQNGSGYPNKLTKNSIDLYSKIIAVACSYEAITAKRPYKDAQDGYHGMLNLLRNENKQYDESVLSSMVRSLSLFPIGQFVLLSSGKKAQVVDSNPNDPRYPVVQIFEEQTPDGRNKIITTAPNQIYITQILDKIDISK